MFVFLLGIPFLQSLSTPKETDGFYKKKESNNIKTAFLTEFLKEEKLSPLDYSLEVDPLSSFLWEWAFI